MRGTRHQGSSTATRVWAALSRRFPDHVALVDQLIKDCGPFRELCDDYLECGKVLRRFEDEVDTAQRKIAEYQDLLACLEQELDEHIGGQATCPHCGKKHGGRTVDR